jgi:hypothetical protein
MQLAICQARLTRLATTARATLAVLADTQNAGDLSIEDIVNLEADLRLALAATRLTPKVKETFAQAWGNLPVDAHDRLGRALDLAPWVTLAGDTYTIPGHNHELTYRINGADCDCPDDKAPFAHNRKACKHQLAVWLSEALQ